MQQQSPQQVNVNEERKEEVEHVLMMAQTTEVADMYTWLIDSGCTSHMTKHLTLFSSLDMSLF